MTYTQGIDFISSTDEVRRLSRNVIPNDFSNDQIAVYQYEVYSGIRTLTDKDDWDSNDREFGALQLREKDITALYIKKHFADSPEQEAAIDAAITAAWQELKTTIVDNMDTATGEEGSAIQVTDYKSWNLNTTVRVPNRLKNFGSGVESKGSVENRWF